MEIVPIRDLKNTVKIETLCATSKGPVFITKNGYGKLVVMDIGYYEDLMNKIYEAAEINRGLKDLEMGNVSKGEDFIEELKLKYGL